jgi:hemolysin activation/secretion protein
VQASALPPGTTDGATRLTLKVTRRPATVSAGLDAQQSKPRVLVTASLNDVISSGGQLSASTLVSSLPGDTFHAVQFTQFIGSQGLSARISGSHYRGDPNAPLQVDNGTQRRASNDRIELSASYPLILDNTTSLLVSGGVYAVNSGDNYRHPGSGVEVNYDTRVRAVFGQFSYTMSRPDTVRRFSLLLAQGINGWGAHATASTNIAGLTLVDPTQLNFRKVSFQASQINQWSAAFGTAILLSGQYSPHRLPSSERISFGGVRMARGYAAGEVSGDSGWGLGLEIHRSFPASLTHLKQVQPYLLVEWAQTENQSSTFLPSKLKSLALGTRLSDQKFFSLDISAARALGDAPFERTARRTRLNAILNYRLEP